MSDRPKPQAGKGDNSRPFSNYGEFTKNFDNIPNFGYRPKWMKPKIEKYPHHLDELRNALIGKKMLGLIITDDSRMADFCLDGNKARLAALYKKYALDESVNSMYIWEVLEKMHDYRPF